jgi:hypothetical protein
LDFLNGETNIEYRRWNTNYRGELFLHCSKKYASKDHAGFIIAKCNLVKIEWNPYEYDGIFEWTLEEIKPLSEKIKANGKLRIWTFPK